MPARRALLALFFVTIPIGLHPAGGVEREELQRRQQLQQRARGLARELVGGILDIQLRQLEENGLAELPIYGEIRTMRANLDGLIDDQMQAVVELLVSAQEGSREQRLADFAAARSRIREIVVQLMAERQRLLRRLQIERLAAEVRQLIQLQSRTGKATDALPERADDQLEAELLAAVADQRDVQSLYLALVEAMVDVSGWAGPAGANAADGLRILKAGRVDEAVDQARRKLESASFAEASDQQKAVLKGLRAVLRQLEEAQGLISSDREAALLLVRDVLQQQKQLREDTRQQDPFDGPEAEPLIERQSEIHQSLGELAETLRAFPATQPLMEQAKASAYEAMAQMFEAEKAPAIGEQDRVIGSLGEIEARLQHQIQLGRDDQSADALAEEVQRLEQLETRLEALAAEQAAVVENVARQDPQAPRDQATVAEALDAAADEATREPLPGVIESRLGEAQFAVREANERLHSDSPADQDARLPSAARAARALERALAETQAQLADSRRRQLAVEVGELARAAEALERAAASEREIGRVASRAAAAQGLSEVELREFDAEQAQVAEVAERIAAGVQTSQPRAAELLKQAQAPIAATAEQIAAARQQAGKPSPAAAGQIAEDAARAARGLAEAAAELRRHVQRTAGQLVDVAGEQLDRLAQVQRPLEDTANRIDRGGSDTIGRLADALDAVQAAQIEQLRAQGRSAAASAAERSRDVDRLMQSQAAAERAAADVRSGRANTPLQAVTQQQQVAEQAAGMAADAGGEVAQALQSVARAASEAARETLGGDPRRAEIARKATARALEAVRLAAEKDAAEAVGQPAQAADPEAQQRVGEHASQALELVGDAEPDSARALADAERSSAAAEASLRAGETEAAAAAQTTTADALQRTAEHLRSALLARAARETQGLEQHAADAAELADRAGPVSPEAAAALDAAEDSARRPTETPHRGSTPGPAQAARPELGPPEMGPPHAAQAASGRHEAIAAAVEQTQQAFQRAKASLAARQQTIQRDRDVARAMAQLADDQSGARAEIERQAERLTTARSRRERDTAEASAARPQDALPGPQEIAAAEALQRATERFANAQRAVGQGAVEISGQREVANQPLREGLQAASELALAAPAGPRTPELDSPGVQPLSFGAADGEQAARAGEPSPGRLEPGLQGLTRAAAEGQSPSGPGAPAPTAGDTAAMGSQAADAAGWSRSMQLGTGLVPDSPEATAAQIAGAEAMAQAAQALAAAPALAAAEAESSGESSSDSPRQAAANSSASPQGQPAPSASLAASGGVSMDGPEAENPETEQGDLQMQPEAQADSRTGTGGRDIDLREEQIVEQPWFARLPPSLREAIRAQARQRPPRGYEERLRRYFGSTD